ncbi:putative 2-aminoethylphosphonate transport system permease protein PhnV [bacterium BMS3Abin02]|nr:putative 2-aminoethylphosphonate transport system permease protein PhnV [bacterium BMS3Abin02]
MTLDTKSPETPIEPQSYVDPAEASSIATRWARRIAVTSIVVVIVVPMGALIIWSFAFRWNFPNLLPTEWGMRAWAYVATDSSRVLEGFWNSIKIAVLVTFMAIVVGLPASRALGQHEFRGKSLVEWLLLMPIIVPALVATMGIYQIFIRLRLVGTLFGVALVHLIPAIPYFVLVMASVFANYGTALEDTARTLGANKIRVFRHVTLPAISSGLLVASMFTFLISWSQYVTTLLIGGGTFITLPLVLFPFLSGGNHSTAAAISLVFVAPAIVVLVMTSRQLSRESTVMGGFGKL